VATWPVLDGDPRWEERLEKHMRQLRTRLQKRLSTAKGEKKASLVAQLKELREDFKKEHTRLAESEKSGGYVVAKSVRKGRSKPPIDSAAEMIGAALGRVVARLDAWKKDRASLAADIQVLANNTQKMLTSLGHTAEGAFKWTRTDSSPKSAKTTAATKGRVRAPRKKQKSPGVDDYAGNARDREMGRADAPLGDLGHGRETWKPPAGEQGLSNRSDDHGTETDNRASPVNAQEQQDDEELEGETEKLGQKGGDRSNRAAHSGATGEQSTSGGQNKPEPRNQDEKGMGHLRNR